MAKKLNYNMHAAINLRGLTIDQANLYDIEYMHPNTRDQVIDFRMSTEITGGDYDWGNIPLHVEVLMGLHTYDLLQMRRTTKEKWRKAYRGWRIYIHQSGDPREPAPSMSPAGEFE